ncbi:MAG: transporter related [Acidimicrobiaceae bacterium]|nr:transporter related [Acidimicrobiaceae bacterium]
MPAHSSVSSATTLVATKVRVERGLELVLNDVSLTVGPLTRVGIVGPNGVGKSTLLAVLAGRVLPESGRVELSPAHGTVGYLAQEHERRDDESVRDYLYRQTGALLAEQELVDAAADLGAGGNDTADRYAAALERWSSLGVDTLEGRMATVLVELGLTEAILEVPSAGLSGGQAARVALAAVLLSRFDVTLLDEPTNDLDFDGLERLERFVASRSGGVVIVSHDRSFLDRMVTSVLEIDEHDHSARLFDGGWEAFLQERQTARLHAQESFANYRAKRNVLLDRARREREWATSGASREKRSPKDKDKAQRDFRLNRTEKLAGRARMTERAAERLETVEKPWEGWDLRFAIESAPRSGTVVFRLDHAVVQRGGFRLGPVSLEIDWAERVAIVGPNGSGKTTLLRALLGHLPLESGERYVGPSVVVGELGQDRSAYSGERRLLDVFVERTGLVVSEARSLLAKFGLGAGHVGRACASLSPGERTRAELAGFQATGVNLLVLDEPTNHLDLPAIEQLEEALSAYSGTLLLVSHDRRLLDSVEVTRQIDMAGLGTRHG